MADSCRFYSYESGFFSGGNTCSVTGTKERVTEDYYRRYCRYDYNRRDCPLYRKYGPYESSGCFITTVVHNILGNPDNCKVLNDFRRFRDDILQKNPQYREGLKEYDGIGPTIACQIAHDKDAKDMADMTYQLDLLKVHKYYLQGEYDKAYLYYCKMTRDLISYYGLDEEYEKAKANDYGYTNFNQAVAGHGKKESHRLVKLKEQSC